MGILDFDAAIYRGANAVSTPVAGNFQVELDGVTFRAMRKVTFPEHKVDKKVLIAAGGGEVLGISGGVLNADSDGTFKLLPLSAVLFLKKLRLRYPFADIHSIKFNLTAYAVDPRTKRTVITKASELCEITNIKTDDVGDGTEEVGTVISFKSEKERLNGISITGI